MPTSPAKSQDFFEIGIRPLGQSELRATGLPGGVLVETRGERILFWQKSRQGGLEPLLASLEAVTRAKEALRHLWERRPERL